MYILMDAETAIRLRGMYHGSLFEPIKDKNGMYFCTTDNITNPAFAEIAMELAKLLIVETVEYEDNNLDIVEVEDEID